MGIASFKISKRVTVSRKMMMKASLIVLLVAVISSQASPSPTVTGDVVTADEVHEIEFTDYGIQQLRAASLKAISFLCLDIEDLDPLIEKHICEKAIKNAFSNAGFGAGSAEWSCTHCEIADPICWNACPQ